MKALFFAVGLISFIVYRGTKNKVNLSKKWEGIYNKNEKKVDKIDKFTGSYMISRFHLAKTVLK